MDVIMFPILLQLGPIKLYSYGLMFALAVIIGTALLMREAKKKGIKPEIISDLVFWGVLSGVLGARIYYVILYPDIFIQDPWEFFRLYNGGLAFQGGFILAVPVGLWYMRKHGLPLLSTFDLIAPYLALAHAIGRLGCFFNGCCYGREWKWGIYFPVHQAKLHPTQLYESALLFLIFFVLCKLRHVLRAPGQVFAFYLILAGIERFVTEFFRADHASTVWGLSNYQLISLGIFLAGLVLLLKGQRRVPSK